MYVRWPFWLRDHVHVSWGTDSEPGTDCGASADSDSDSDSLKLGDRTGLSVRVVGVSENRHPHHGNYDES